MQIILVQNGFIEIFFHMIKKFDVAFAILYENLLVLDYSDISRLN